MGGVGGQSDIKATNYNVWELSFTCSRSHKIYMTNQDSKQSVCIINSLSMIYGSRMTGCKHSLLILNNE